MASQPVMMSSISSPAPAAVSRASVPGKVIANTSSARISVAPSKPLPKAAQAATSTRMATAGSTMANTNAAAPGWLRARRVRDSEIDCKATAG